MNPFISIRVQKGVPLPKLIKQPPRRPNRGNKIYPWLEMAVGDSFLFPENTSRQAAYSNAAQASKRGVAKFTSRKIDDRFRCWRYA